MRLNTKPTTHKTLASDAIYRPDREFWERPDVKNAVQKACQKTADWLKTNETFFKRLEAPDASTGEFYCEVVAPWFNEPEPSDSPVRMKLRKSRLDDKVREQGLIDLFSRRLPRALGEVNGGAEYWKFQLDGKDWSEILNASAWSILDETLGAYEAPNVESRLPFTELKKVYGFQLRTPVTRLAENVAVRFSRMGLFRMHYENQYFAATGSVYHSFYHMVYEPVSAHFQNQLQEGQHDA